MSWFLSSILLLYMTTILLKNHSKEFSERSFTLILKMELTLNYSAYNRRNELALLGIRYCITIY